MPKKSRREKMRATSRLQSKILEGVTITYPDLPAKDAQQKPVTLVEKTAEKQPSAADQLQVSFFRHDMQKSLLLIAAIIALEIIFYFASMSTVWSKLFNF